MCNNQPFINTCFSHQPINEHTNQEKVDRLAQARFSFAHPKWRTVSSAGKGFVRGLLKKTPGFRWTAREALDHCADSWGPSLLVTTTACHSFS